MYSTCLFCNGALGRNEAIEHFPVGRRLAFDGAKGRLWVVCPTCLRWNLSPLETRWEAIEDAERAYRGTKLRASTDNIGLAKLKEGTELVRIGAPQLPEFAGWRYGEVFQKRHRKAVITGFASTATGFLLNFTRWAPASYSTLAMSFTAVTSISALSLIGYDVMRKRRGRVWIHDDNDQRLRVAPAQSRWAKIVRDSDGDEWHLRVAHQRQRAPGILARAVGRTSASEVYSKYTDIHGPAALRALAGILPIANWWGADRSSVDFAVGVVERHAHYLDELRDGAALPRTLVSESQSLEVMRLPARLALEMLLHESDERRALEGELAALAERWREAEEIAQISDDMFVSDSANERLNELSQSRDPDATKGR